MKTVICLVDIKKGRLLLVRKRSHWIIPGGKLEKEDMSDEDTLLREFSEELPSARISVDSYYRSFTGKTPYSKMEMVAKVYFGNVENVGDPSREINRVEYVKYFQNYNLSEVAKKVVDALRKEGHLKNE